MRISVVVAVADNGVIGRAGELPWHLPDDLKHFRALTLGKSVLMGRRTFEAIGRPLPGRQNLIMSHAVPPLAAPTLGAPAVAATDVQVVVSLQQAVVCARERSGEQAELCVIGGAQIYALSLAYASRIYLTEVHASVPGDVYFPGYQPAAPHGNLAGWRESERSSHAADARHAYGMSFVTLERMQASPTV
ncbi:MAG TPA: dihydrofolate reductase [Steroidobacteraceae bacterium]|jgi:dihydrofolate reductase|nr:dihydrofolate reductase [Steroidobacteraceae bacterium]